MPDQDTGLTDVAESDLTTRRGMFRAVAFRDPIDGHEHMALVFGAAVGGEDVLVRVHSECLSGDIFGATRCECGEQLASALDTIVREGSGILVYLRGHEGRGIGLVAKVRTHILQDEQGLDTIDSATSLGLPVDVRDYGPAARVLRYLGVDSVRLMSNNSDKVDALEAHGVRVAERVPLLAPAHPGNIAYLTAKRDRLGHDLPHIEAVRTTPAAPSHDGVAPGRTGGGRG
ncbi:3,4-dihydroxy 2-butanone 4-phosphate synthase/GTP cyclohydrolase II [Nocardiopsis mwathae]|uniref:GTP cyclohydrolase-2 n=1 Tax=Nocardiopsis mwathae TaxID=1472723 RepID=A0A7X0D772_9ACTN|nr:GTP cyclohydrolase II [Nocardiopsis mwathae]MBB6174035.1 3,4-dihydroxy 2-butanone 4-phosphate synthase/GTP cyclohydrolase II [Nocardiopsis mwathae]